ncbi:hypothetical protein [Croceicoccus bisphenolivorans]|uniref:hypothetical protein n=1 Tax=Croceicoccus bisphenolivorans TaxID=1783232 RepID=UPI00082AE876|nr:hypothetical protein [Croceicoccus bisphenolivorans]
MGGASFSGLTEIDEAGAFSFEYDGFAMVLSGAAPGASARTGPPQYFFDIRNDGLEGTEAILLAPGGAANDNVSPLEMVRGLAAATLALTGAAHCIAVGWQPASSVMNCDYFAKVAREWLDGGPFPALGLASLMVEDGDVLVSRGMDAICGQEIAIAPIAGMANADRARAAIRMIDYMANHGRIREPDTMEIDGFGLFEVNPDASGKKIYLSRSPFA